MIFTRNPFPFLVTPHHPHGSSRLLDRGHLLDKPWTIPLTSQALASTMATAFRSRLGSFGIFRGCHWCHTHSCFLRGFLSAFPIAQPRSHLVEGGDPAWWPIRFLLDKCVWLLAVLLFFPQTKLLKAGLTLHDPQNFFPKHQGCLWARELGCFCPRSFLPECPLLKRGCDCLQPPWKTSAAGRLAWYSSSELKPS